MQLYGKGRRAGTSIFRRPFTLTAHAISQPAAPAEASVQEIASSKCMLCVYVSISIICLVHTHVESVKLIIIVDSVLIARVIKIQVCCTIESEICPLLVVYHVYWCRYTQHCGEVSRSRMCIEAVLRVSCWHDSGAQSHDSRVPYTLAKWTISILLLHFGY